MTLLKIDDARDLARRVLVQHRLTPDDADVVADHLVDAHLTGYTFAGLPRLLVVLDRIRAEDQAPPPIRIEDRGPVSAFVHGNGNLGYVVCRRAVDAAIDKA